MGHDATSDVMRDKSKSLKLKNTPIIVFTSTLSHNYSYFCCNVGRTWAVLIFRRRSKYLIITKFYAESNGNTHSNSETSYRAAI
jgi:hypothetical protein